MPKNISHSLLKQLDNNEILLIHLGGLGDVCLSESLFLSFQKHFGDCLVGLGNRRFLDLFKEYFVRVEGVESRRWLYLFSEKLGGPQWRQIIFIGKDRESILRNRWQSHSQEEIIFIDMYPEYAFERVSDSTLSRQGMQGEALSSHSEREGVSTMALLLEGATRAPLIEDYQLAQLVTYDVKALKKIPTLKGSQKIILYPEKGFEKEKWHHENFVNLYHSLTTKGLDTVVLESLGLSINVVKRIFFEDLKEVKQFFFEGGIFVSNDSGMAHLAGASGLFTITIFAGFDPAIWHPRGRNISLLQKQDISDLPSLEKLITQTMNDFQ